MSKLAESHRKTIQLVKQKIMDDLSAYLGRKEKCVSFDQYLIDRRQYLDQIWLTVWLNKVSNDLPHKEKKTLLKDRRIISGNTDRKVVNKLFRSEMKRYERFDVWAWLKEKYGGKHTDWTLLYDEARAQYLEQEKERHLELKKGTILQSLEQEAIHFLEKEQEALFLKIRYNAALQLQSDLTYNKRFHAVEREALEEELDEAGSFEPSNYKEAADFFEELTGRIHQVGYGFGLQAEFEYETYYDQYEQLVFNELVNEVVSQEHMDGLFNSYMNEYKELFDEEMDADRFQELILPYIDELAEEIFDEIAEDYVTDLLNTADIPFEVSVHKELYERTSLERVQRKAREVEKAERQRIEEALLIEDIFGQEYSLSPHRSARYVLHIGETNTGKTHQALQRMKQAESGLYLAPLRLLALEVYDKLNADGVPCSLKTGEEEKLHSEAKHISCTVEMFHEKDFYEVVVIDEAQMIADKDRGFSWYKAITKANAREVHIIGSRNIKQMLLDLVGDAEYEIHDYTREVPLQVEPNRFTLSHVTKGDALVCFSRKEVLETASKLRKSRHSVSMIYGSMPPETRKKQIQQFNSGETKVMVSTDAIGMGLNLPIRRIVFLKNEKFDGTRRRRLTSQEVKQIAGRAGRKGIYPKGRVAFSADVRTMEFLLQKEDEPLTIFTVAPTASIFERFLKYYRSLGLFFELWEQFESPKGTMKASLHQERELYELIQGTDIEARLSVIDLYSFLHLPFSTKESSLKTQWYKTMKAIVHDNDLPEPRIKTGNLEDLELSYKAIGLHVLFLYKLNRPTEAIYWERFREEISNGVHEHLQIDVKPAGRTCRRCRASLPQDFHFSICDACHREQKRSKYGTKRSNKKRN
ncbi:ATP-dependent RNA helicase SUPV3L1/SUV3 [Bacillus ectoiniformans]|uniref:DEAD/DEAH box helicase n=1 Tax=Bacillus ectoiniformans TaxID=1494429 RepID=UPI00195C8DA8|nr:helicase-related protein [Bacillus ectoiniformans]MBM7649109.1 ATP-dependent RNA helicase SUPV3L1/SUV3 [Bacillus ectoiniformans]